MTYQIKTGNPQYTGIREGVAIQSGTATTDDADKAKALAGLGYDVQPDPAEKPVKAEKK